MQCYRKRDTQFYITRGASTANSGSNFAYFRTHAKHSSLYEYDISQDVWNKPSQPPYKDYGLVCIDGQVTAVGGMDEMFRSCNQLFSLYDRLRGYGHGWEEKHPPMITPRTYPAAVNTRYDGQDYVIVAGQQSHSLRVTSIEVLSNGKWCHRANLPHHIQFLLASVSDTTFYVISGDDFIGYSVSLRELLIDERPKESQNSPLTLQWTRLPRSPVRITTPACMHGEFFLVGGRDSRGERSSAIYQLWMNRFVEVGHLSEPRAACGVATVSPNKMVVVGGGSGKPMLSQTVDVIRVRE